MKAVGKKYPQVGLKEQLNGTAVKFSSSNPNPFVDHGVWSLFVQCVIISSSLISAVRMLFMQIT